MFLNEGVLAFGAGELFTAQNYFAQPKLPPDISKCLLWVEWGLGSGDDTNHPLKETDFDCCRTRVL